MMQVYGPMSGYFKEVQVTVFWGSKSVRKLADGRILFASSAYGVSKGPSK